MWMESLAELFGFRVYSSLNCADSGAKDQLGRRAQLGIYDACLQVAIVKFLAQTMRRSLL